METILKREERSQERTREEMNEEAQVYRDYLAKK